MEKDYYKILGITVSAKFEEIKQAYKQKALEFHPDKNKTKGAEGQFKLILEAYTVLIDKDKRREYDMKRNFKKFDPFSSNNNHSRRDQSSNTNFNNNNRGRKRERDDSSSKTEHESFKHFHSHRSYSEPPPRDFNFNFNFMFNPPPENFFNRRPNFNFNNFSESNNGSEHTNFGQQNGSRKQDPPIKKEVFVTLEELAACSTKRLKITRNVTGIDGVVRQESKIHSISVGPFSLNTKITLYRQGDEDKRDSKRVPADIVVNIRIKSSSNTGTSTSEEDSRSASSPSTISAAEVFQGLNLKPELIKGAEDTGCCSTLFVEKKALRILLKKPGVNLISVSSSRTGKIVAYCLALLNSIDPNMNATQVIIVALSCEHTYQIGSIIRKVGKFCEGISVSMLMEGKRIETDVETPHILIGDPNQIFQWMLHRESSDLARLRIFVLDAADIMPTQLAEELCRQIERKIPDNTQRLFFAALLNHEIMTFAEKIAPNATIIHQH